MSFAVIVELASWIAFAVVLLGGVQQRSYGWKMVIPLLGFAALVQMVGMSIIVGAFKCRHHQIINIPLRHISTITMTDSFQDGSSIFHGFSAQLAGVCFCLLALELAPQPTSFPVKVATNL